jgi:hypothetical protein
MTDTSREGSPGTARPGVDSVGGHEVLLTAFHEAAHALVAVCHACWCGSCPWCRNARPSTPPGRWVTSCT